MSSPTWRFDQDNLWRLPGAHGEEVIRSVYLDEQVGIEPLVTCLSFSHIWLPGLTLCIIRVNASSLAARTVLCEHGSLLERMVAFRSSLERRIARGQKTGDQRSASSLIRGHRCISLELRVGSAGVGWRCGRNSAKCNAIFV